jgi:hypothetical protein
LFAIFFRLVYQVAFVVCCLNRHLKRLARKVMLEQQHRARINSRYV